MADTLTDVARSAAEAWGERLEAACEEMLTDPRGWGVLVHVHEPQLITEGEHFTMTETRTLGLSPAVPFGEVHEHRIPKDGTCRACIRHWSAPAG